MSPAVKRDWMAALSHVTKGLIGAAALSVALGSAPAQAQSAGNVVAGPFPVTLPSTQTFSYATNFNVPPPLQNSYVVRVQLSAPNSLTAASLKLNLKGPAILLATAHPAKFPDAINQAIGIAPEIPKKLAGLMALEERYTVLPNEVGSVRTFVLERTGTS